MAVTKDDNIQNYGKLSADKKESVTIRGLLGNGFFNLFLSTVAVVISTK